MCFIHFKLFPFPTKKKDPTARESLGKIINRNIDLKGCKLWEPSKDSRVFSKHFIDRESIPNKKFRLWCNQLFLSPPSNKRK